MKTVKSLLLAAACASALNCAAAKTETVNSNTAPNIIAVNSNTANANQTAAEQTRQTTATSPDALVKDLYKQHDSKDSADSPFFQTKNRALVDKYFEKKLADTIWNEANEPRDGVGAIEVDPLYDAQDSDIKNFAVGEPKINGDKAQVVVSFTNFGKKQFITYELAEQNAVWKISDINYGGGSTLSEVYRNYAKSLKEESGGSGGKGN